MAAASTHGVTCEGLSHKGDLSRDLRKWEVELLGTGRVLRQGSKQRPKAGTLVVLREHPGGQ